MDGQLFMALRAKGPARDMNQHEVIGLLMRLYGPGTKNNVDFDKYDAEVFLRYEGAVHKVVLTPRHLTPAPYPCSLPNAAAGYVAPPS
jgi:hypothetical protein